MSLFRKEVVDHQSERLTGNIVLAQSLSIQMTTLIISSFVLMLVVFFFTAEYARKETVRGYLVPDKGLIKSYAPEAGTIQKLWVEANSTVNKGDPLVTIVVSKNDEDGKELSEKLIHQLHQQQVLTNQEMSKATQLYKKEKKIILKRSQMLIQEEAYYQDQLSLIDKKMELLIRQDEKIKQLGLEGYVSQLHQDQHTQSLIEAGQEKNGLLRQISQHQSAKEKNKLELEKITHAYQAQKNNLKLRESEIINKIDQIQVGYKYTVRASDSGVVTAIHVFEGEMLSRSQVQTKPLMHIIPTDSKLEAVLLLPSRSAGFTDKGQVARLRFEAFPYQRFGFIESVVTHVDGALISPSEQVFPVQPSESVYRIRADLNQQYIDAYGKQFDLKNGMLFEADIMLDKRTLVEWVFDPLFSLKGRIN